MQPPTIAWLVNRPPPKSICLPPVALPSCLGCPRISSFPKQATVVHYIDFLCYPIAVALHHLGVDASAHTVPLRLLFQARNDPQDARHLRHPRREWPRALLFVIAPPLRRVSEFLAWLPNFVCGQTSQLPSSGGTCRSPGAGLTR